MRFAHADVMADTEPNTPEAILDLIAEGLIIKDTPTYDMAMRVVRGGLQSLSARQLWVYDRHVTPLLLAGMTFKASDAA